MIFLTFLFQGAFSLAYGTLTLLRDAKMHLKRNRFYGLLGPNQCGKTTLMRAIANEQLEGFPKRDELKSVFVEHEIEDEEVDVDMTKQMWYSHGKHDLNKLEDVWMWISNIFKYQMTKHWSIAMENRGEKGWEDVGNICETWCNIGNSFWQEI